MKRHPGLAAVMFLSTVLIALPCPALNQSVTRQLTSDRAFAERTRASLSSIAVALQHSSSTSSQGSLRKRLIQHLAVPDTAVVIFAVGVLLIFLECNSPGAILPGAFGLLLLLSGIYGLSLHPLRPAALLVLLTAGALLSFSAKGARPVMYAFGGTSGLICGLWTLVPSADAALRVHLPVAAVVGLVIGPAAFFLARIAERARRNKTILATSPHATPINTRN